MVPRQSESLTHKPNVEMETARLRIEVLTPNHASILFGPLQSPELYTFTRDERPRSLEALKKRFEWYCWASPADELWKNWVLFDKKDDAVMGTLQATIYRDRRAEIAYAVLPHLWRQGIGSSSVRWMLSEIKAAHAIRTAEAVIDTNNHASIGVVRKLGFHLIETTRSPNGAGSESRFRRPI